MVASHKGGRVVEEEARVGLGDSRFIHKYELLGCVRDTHAEAPLEALYYIALPGLATAPSFADERVSRQLAPNRTLKSSQANSGNGESQ